MSTRILTGWLASACLLLAQPAPPAAPKAAPKAAAAASSKPKLVLAIAVDQFRYDYLTRFRSEYTGGLQRLLTRGAVFTNARYEHFPTVTAIGHSTFLTGAVPALSGIVANEWWDRETSKEITSVSDPKTTIVGGRGGEGFVMSGASSAIGAPKSGSSGKPCDSPASRSAPSSSFLIIISTAIIASNRAR